MKSACALCGGYGHNASKCRWRDRGANILAIIALAFLTACGGGGSGGASAPGFLPIGVQAQAEPEPIKLVHVQVGCSVTLYGDSIMAANGSNETPAATLKRLRSDIPVIDKSVAGTRLMVLAQTFANDPRTSRVVVFENGTIDSWFGTDPGAFRQTLADMIDYVRAEGRVPVVTGLSRLWPVGAMTPQFMAGRDAFNGLVQQLAAEKGVIFSDWGSVRFDGESDLQDGIHPGKAYSDRLIERLATSVDAACA